MEWLVSISLQNIPGRSSAAQRKHQKPRLAALAQFSAAPRRSEFVMLLLLLPLI